MTTVASIILDGLRESNLIPIGMDATANQTTEAFRRLSTIVNSVLGNEFGEQLNPIPLGQDNIEAPAGYPWWENAPPNDTFLTTNLRIMCNLTGVGTVNFHPRPHDGARMGIVDVAGNFATNPLTINGNGRNIEGDPSQTYSTNGELREWIYREDLGNWVVVTPLTEDGEMPFPPEFDDFFIVSLAMRVNPRYGKALSAESQAALQRGRTQFRARYTQSTTTERSELGLLYLTSQYRFNGYYSNRAWGDPESIFNSGYPY